MRDITVGELYALYLDTIERCTTELRNRSDEDIRYELFEQFDVGAQSFLHDDSLVRLRDSGYIDNEMVALSQEVRKRWFVLQPRPWTVEEIRTRHEWQELFELCDRLKSKSRSIGRTE
jgi:hypothetical protein